MKKLLKKSLAVLSVAIISMSCSAAENRPNVIILLADDMGFGDIGAFGSEIDTPHIDQLAREGIHFTNFHVGAACSPTRTMLMTGVDNHLAGMGNMLEIQADNQFGKPDYEGHLNDKVVTVASLLRDEGYHTYMAGKWHLGHTKETLPHSQGFEKTFALMESGADNWVEQPYAPMYKAVHYFENGKPVKLPTEGYFSSDFYTQRIIGNIEANRIDGKPFFAYVAYQAVHYPHQAPKQFIDKYNGVYDEGYEALRKSRLERQKELGIISKDVKLDEGLAKTTFEDYKISPWDSLNDEEKKFNARRMQTYAGMLDNMDSNIGKLLSYLESIGEAENTLILFLSDNGADPNQFPITPEYRDWYKKMYQYSIMEDYKGDYSSMGQKGSFADYGPGWAAASVAPTSYFKTFSTEGGLRVPFIAKYPGKIAAGESNNKFAFVKDIVPTVLEIAGVDNPGTAYKGKKIHAPDGKSMWSVLTSIKPQVHEDDESIGYELAGSSAVFRGKYKLVQNLPPKGTGQWELYDIESDPSELHDLTNQKPKLAAELLAAYQDYEKENNVVPVPEGYNPFEQAIKNSKRKDVH
ncbi:arylsulfatase [Alkalimarinus coralli]|uniref:arylsulfatase n=1 Tax=Alkalimarinus coralli TaxID=2935863 RepID=UPI00202AD41C|nr:arylsulfatase [Alkalimarinus coralli]